MILPIRININKIKFILKSGNSQLDEMRNVRFNHGSVDKMGNDIHYSTFNANEKQIIVDDLKTSHVRDKATENGMYKVSPYVKKHVAPPNRRKVSFDFHFRCYLNIDVWILDAKLVPRSIEFSSYKNLNDNILS